MKTKNTIYKEILKSNHLSSIIKIVLISTLASSLISCNSSETKDGWNHTFSNGGSSDEVKNDSSSGSDSSSSSSGSSGSTTSSGSSSGSSGTCNADAQPNTCIYTSNLSTLAYDQLSSSCQDDGSWDANVNSCSARVGSLRTAICTQILPGVQLQSYVFEVTEGDAEINTKCELLGGTSQILNN